jgi:hypothetical protein
MFNINIDLSGNVMKGVIDIEKWIDRAAALNKLKQIGDSKTLAMQDLHD